MHAEPEFEGRYLARCALWTWRDAGAIDVLDVDGSLRTRLDGWQTVVFHAADGSTTLDEIVAGIADRYTDESPAEYRAKVTAAARTLVAAPAAVALAEAKADLPPYYERPVEEQDRADLTRALKEAGLL